MGLGDKQAGVRGTEEGTGSHLDRDLWGTWLGEPRAQGEGQAEMKTSESSAWVPCKLHK